MVELGAREVGFDMRRIKPIVFRGKAKDFTPIQIQEPGITYIVQSSLNPVAFKRKKDAKEFQRLLLVSTSKMKSVIVRREITKEGFELEGDNTNV